MMLIVNHGICNVFTFSTYIAKVEYWVITYYGRVDDEKFEVCSRYYAWRS